MERLSDRTLGQIAPAIAKPAYDRSQVTPGIVHLGIGAFHRAHQAVAVDDRLAAGENGWGIIAASLRSADTHDALAPQDGLYTLAVRGSTGTDLRVIGAISEVIVATRQRERLIAAMASAQTRIVSLTVTEKGYCREAATGELNEQHTDIVHDLANPHAPISAPGLIVEALRRRRASGIRPFTVLCCDNLPANGRTVHGVLAGLASLQDRDLGQFIAAELACPSTMVDRIVPATTDEDRAMVSARLGLEDAWPVMTETFTQWVVEDRFGLGRPALEEAGVELVGDVAPHEMMKLRLLNGTHSTMAYLGQLAGLETVSDVISQPYFGRLVRRMMDGEIGPTLQGISAAQVEAYKGSLITRFGNTALRHRTAQIAMDGSQKIPQRLLGTARDRLAAGQPIALIGLALAGFCRFMTGTGEDGAALPVNDPLAESFATAARHAGAMGIARLPGAGDAATLASRLSEAMLGITEVFGGMGRDPRFADAVTKPLAALYRHGARQVVAELAVRDQCTAPG
jgi:fructuronate reductase